MKCMYRVKKHQLIMLVYCLMSKYVNKVNKMMYNVLRKKNNKLIGQMIQLSIVYISWLVTIRWIWRTMIIPFKHSTNS